MSNAPQHSPAKPRAAQPHGAAPQDLPLASLRDRVRASRGEIALAVALTVCAVGFTIAAILSTQNP